MAINKVNIELTKDEAIVLFEFLRKINKKKWSEDLDNLAEQRVLWDIECSLEKELNEPFQLNYLDIVKRAREEVINDNKNAIRQETDLKSKHSDSDRKKTIE